MFNTTVLSSFAASQFCSCQTFIFIEVSQQPQLPLHGTNEYGCPKIRVIYVLFPIGDAFTKRVDVDQGMSK